MTDREKLIEVMAIAAYSACCKAHQLTPNYKWENETEDHRWNWREQQRCVIDAAERAGFRIIGPDDGR